MFVTIRHWGGMVEDVTVEEAMRLFRAGTWFQLLSPLPVESAMLAPDGEAAVLPRPAAKRRRSRAAKAD